MIPLHRYYSRRRFTKKALSWIGSLAASAVARPVGSSFSSAFHPLDWSEAPLPETLRAFAAVEPIDGHVHVYAESRLWNDMLKTLHLRVLNICVVDKHERGFGQAEFQQREALRIFHDTHGQAAWCSPFDPENFESPDFASTSIRLLNKTFDEGAVAAKIYKEHRNGTQDKIRTIRNARRSSLCTDLHRYRSARQDDGCAHRRAYCFLAAAGPGQP